MSSVHARPLRALALGLIAMSIIVAPAIASDHSRTGPSSSQSPYLVGRGGDVRLISILSVGDAVPHANRPGVTYQLAGIPDGIGTFDNGDGTFTMLVNHELEAGAGRVRDHGAAGAFVSRWTIRKRDLRVLDGEDLIKEVILKTATGTNELRRLCSASLPARTAFFDPVTGLGYPGRIFMDGEEIGTEGRAFGTVVETGQAYELPDLGRFSWENDVANPATGGATLTIGLDDSTPGQVYVYQGAKRFAGSPVERAGLVGGTLSGIKVDGVLLEDRATGIGAHARRFSLASLGNVAAKTGVQIEAESNAAGATRFLRPEDGSWDPAHPNDFYFNTTDRFDTVKRPGAATTPNTPPAQQAATRLWRLRFDDRNHPDMGGTIELLIDGAQPGSPVQMLDNLTVDGRGNVLLQEDPGGQAYLARVWRYSIGRGRVQEIARGDVQRFGDDEGHLPGAKEGRTFSKDEESSGVVDASEVLGRGAYLLDVQAHDPFEQDPTLVEDGQLLALFAGDDDDHHHGDH